MVGTWAVLSATGTFAHLWQGVGTLGGRRTGRPARVQIVPSSL
jgi:hypothetical protein